MSNTVEMMIIRNAYGLWLVQANDAGYASLDESHETIVARFALPRVDVDAIEAKGTWRIGDAQAVLANVHD